MSNIYDIVIIGGGPCGISAIVEAKMSGLENVLMLEKGSEQNQTIRKFYKDNKRVDKEYKGLDSENKGKIQFYDGTKESTLSYFDKLIDEEKAEVLLSSEVENVTKKDGIFTVHTASKHYPAKFVIICIGKMGRPNKPDYKIPASINSLVNFNLDKCGKDEKILVVGGGNSAAEYAINLSDDNEVTLCYRQFSFPRLNDINLKHIYEAARDEKVHLKLGFNINALENENGKVKVFYTNGESETFDRVIYAIGGTMPVDFLKKCEIKLDDKDEAIVDEHCQTNIENLYMGGDIITKNGGSIVVAMNHAHIILQDILRKRANS